LVAANGGKPVISHKTSIQQLGWVEDTEAEYELIRADEAYSSYSDINEPTV